MRRFSCIFGVLVGIGLTAGAGISQAEGLQDILSGKTLTSPKGRTVYVLGSDGRLSGTIAKEAVVGIWDIRNGQWCRSISEPAVHAGDACRTVAVDGQNVTLISSEQAVVYTMK
ncbi:hypothetical protein [Tropicimonas aquimaris]|uniref:Uncharacterized protein n=1 Tax=Tropicimonas aquimaris TaxID=914152 RepID=A0ABW3ISI4_9RHOB